MKYSDKPRTAGPKIIGGFFVWLVLAAASPADDFTTSFYQPYALPPLTWNDAIWLPGPAVPTAGNTYEVLDGGLIRNPPATGVQTFPGDSLTLDSGAAIKAKGPCNTTLNFPGVNGNPGLILNGGTVIAADNQVFTIAGRISIMSDSVIDHCSSVRGFTITARIEGAGGLTLINGGDDKPFDVQSEHNPYTGPWLIQQGYLKGTGDGSFGTGSITVTNGAMLEIDYDILSEGALMLLGDDSLMILQQDCQFSAVAIDGVVLAPGTYSYAQLAARFPGNFADGGSGSITIAPLISSAADLAASDGETQADPWVAPLEEVADATVSATTSIGTGESDLTPNLVPAGNADAMAPLAVSGVIASADSATQVTICWNPSDGGSGSGIAGYRIFRGGALIGMTTATRFSDNGLNPSTEYCYTVIAFDGAGNNSSSSAQSCATTQTRDTTAPSVPSGLIASANSATEVTVQWTASTDFGGWGVQGYRIFRNGMLVGLTAGTSFTDSGLTPDTQYCYIVDAFDYNWNRSSLSAQACATTPPSSGAAPDAPSNLTVTAVAAASLALNWEDNAADELGFQIERAPSADGPWVLVGTTEADATSYTDGGLAPSTTYYYRVSAFN